MKVREGNGDEKEIRALIGAHFQGLKWTPNTRADWPKFRADFLPDASLYPAARPAQSKTLTPDLFGRLDVDGSAQSMSAQG